MNSPVEPETKSEIPTHELKEADTEKEITAEISARMEKQTAVLARMEKQTAEVDTRMEIVTAEVDTRMEIVTAEVDTRMEKLTAEVDIKMKEMKAKVDELTQVVERLEDDLTGNINIVLHKQEFIENRLDELEERVGMSDPASSRRAYVPDEGCWVKARSTVGLEVDGTCNNIHDEEGISAVELRLWSL